MTISKATLEASLDLVASLYAGEGHDAAQPLDRLAQLLASRGAQLYRFDRRTGAVLEARSDSHPANVVANRVYMEEWGRHDPRPALSAAQRSGTVLRCHEHFSPAFVARNAYYQEFFIPYGFRWGMGGVLHAEDGTSTVLASLRAPDQGPYEPWARDVLAAVMPHFQRAAAVQRMLQSDAPAQARTLAVVLEHLQHPCWVCDGRGRVQAIGARASQGAFGGELPMRRGLGDAGAPLRFDQADWQARWERGLAQAATSGVPVTLPMRLGGSGFQLHVCPWRALGRPADARERQLFLVIAERAPESPPERLARFAAAHGITAAESQVLKLLSNGLVVKEIARQRGCSVATVRTQLGALLQKTQSHTQRQLLASLAAHLAPASRV